jgi:glycine cleavage system T protein (aminomethyltransferase)
MVVLHVLKYERSVIMAEKKTPLYNEHVELGGKVVDYAGWLLPIQYEGLVPEHNAVRNEAGIFDVSHMGAVNITGKDAEKFIDYLMTNDISKLEEHQIAYTFMCYEDGGVVDDLLVYKYNTEKYFLVVNAANVDKDFEWMQDKSKDFDVELENASEDTSILAVQGPLAQEILQKMTNEDLSNIKFFYFKEAVEICDVEVMISRTGYTGEDGFEIYTKPENAPKLWNEILLKGKDKGIKPVGLGCRDTLRFEAGLPLYGQEISKEINPLEAGFKYFVKLKKESDFIGKDALKKQWEEGLNRKLVGFEITDRGIPRAGYDVYKNGEKIGHVTTGYMSPTLGKSIGNALIDLEYTELGEEIDIMIRKKPAKAKVIKKAFLKNK